MLIYTQMKICHTGQACAVTLSSCSLGGPVSHMEVGKCVLLTVGVHVSGVNGKLTAFSAPISGNKHSPCFKDPFRLPESTKV